MINIGSLAKTFCTALALLLVMTASPASAQRGNDQRSQISYFASYKGQVRFNVRGLIRTGIVSLEIEVSGNQITGVLFPADDGTAGFGFRSAGIPVKGQYNRGRCSISSGRGDRLEGQCDQMGFSGTITSFGLHPVSNQIATHQIFMSPIEYKAIDTTLRNQAFTAIATRPIALGSRTSGTCASDLILGARSTLRDEINNPENALLPSEVELDEKMAQFGSCNYPYFTLRNGFRSTRVFPGLKPYFIDPFASGPLQDQLASATAGYDNINADDALAEPLLWRYVSTYVAYETVKEFYDRNSKSPSVGSQFPRPTPADMERARKVAQGARAKAVRAILWQYAQMTKMPSFPIEMCSRYGMAQQSIDYTPNRGWQVPDTDMSADAQFIRYNEGFRTQALPSVMAAFGHVRNSSQLVDEQSGRYRDNVWKMASAYHCLRDSEGFMATIASNMTAQLRAERLEVAAAQARAETARQEAAAKSALARNARAASGNYAPVDDDIIRAIIDARRDGTVINRPFVNAYLPDGLISDSYNYETGIYEENLAVQQSLIRHSVRNTQCTAASRNPIAFDCSYEASINVTVTLFGMTLPSIDMPFTQQRGRVLFRNGRWEIEGLAASIRAARTKQAQSASSYDFAKGARQFHCISSNNFADQFGLVRNIDC